MARGDDVTSFNAKRVRADIPQLHRVVFDRPITYLDTASTSLQPNAVIDAIRPLGVDYINMPLSPMRVWQAIHSEGDSA